jgi:outer membrane protein TolC
MARIAWCIPLVVLTACPARAAAQEPLTLERAVSMTLSQNASLRAAHHASAEAGARVSETKSAFYPRVTFVESWQHSNQPVFVFGSLLSARRFEAANFALDSLNHPDAISFFRASLGVEQVIFDAGRERAAAASASIEREIAATSVDETAAALVLETGETFGRVLLAEAARRAAESALASAREDLARAERRRDAGMATDADVLGLAVQVADFAERGIQAQGDSAIARARLNRLMGAPIETAFNIVEPGPVDSGQTSSVTALFAEADRARPELRRAEAAERLAAEGRRAARSGLIPRVAAQAVVDLDGTRFSDRESAWLVGGELRWSFSTGGAEMARMKAADEAGARARAELDDIRAGIHVEVIAALRRLESATARQAAGRAAVEQALESQRIVRDRFGAGLASVNDVLRASTAVLDAERNRTSALIDAIVSQAALHRALGRTP